MNIILLGYRGCGKSTLGRQLAQKTWKDFFDIDALVREQYDGATVSEIWETHGEPAYRAAEVRVTQKVVEKDNCVIALGGGTLMQPGARAAVMTAPDSKRIYLHCRPTQLAQRIAGDPQGMAGRPALTLGASGSNDADEIEQVLIERDPVYRAVADAVLDVTHIDLEGSL
ncbi:MAG: shikimate kinase, partial [Algisphaera sp.]